MEILVVEDNPQDVELLKLTLRRTPSPPQITHTDSIAAACTALRESLYDVVVLDLNLPDSDGLATLRQLQEANDSVPIVVMTGYDDDELGREAVHLGAEDYLVKGSGTPASIMRSLNYAIERNHTANELRYLAHHDALTGTPNPEDFVREVERVIARTERTWGMAAVLTLNVDRFQLINETLGHAGGDEFLRQLAHRLETTLRRVDTLARLNGDELAIVLDGLQNERDAEIVAERIHDTLRKPLLIKGHEVSATVSIGAALFPADGRTAVELMTSSATALRRAKSNGRNRTTLFGEDAEQRLQRRRALRGELTDALARGEFAMRYDLRLELGTRTVRGITANLCWNHPGQGLLHARNFLPGAEQEQLGARVEEHGICLVLDQICAWTREHQNLPTVSLQVVPSHFLAATFPERLAELLRERNLGPKSLEVCVTETIMVQRPGRAIENIKKLNDLGVPVGIVDFGSSFSPFSYLTYVPINSIGLASRMVNALGEPRHAAVARAIMTLARDLGMLVSGEGLVLRSQLAHLNDLNCTIVQSDPAAVLDGESMTRLLSEQLPSSKALAR
jgi:diguanylate cyclase (GGDEF)-like protein